VAKSRKEMAAQAAAQGTGAAQKNQSFLPVAQRMQAPAATESIAPEQDTHKLSNRQYEQLLRQNFINIRRVREWRDIYSAAAYRGGRAQMAAQHPACQLRAGAPVHAVPACWATSAARAKTSEAYLGARGIKFHPHPGAHLSKKPGAGLWPPSRWKPRACLAGALPRSSRSGWKQVGAGHLLKKQLLDPHWEQETRRGDRLERATLYGLVVYNNRGVNYGRKDPHDARRNVHPRALVEGEWETQAGRFWPPTRKLIRRWKTGAQKPPPRRAGGRRADLRLLRPAACPPTCSAARLLSAWYREASQEAAPAAALSKDELMRHEAAGITTDAFPKPCAWAVSIAPPAICTSPGDAKDGLTVTVPLFVLNQVSEERCRMAGAGHAERKNPGAAEKPAPAPAQPPGAAARKRRRLAALFTQPERWGHGGLIDALLKQVRQETAWT
jgi:ATP-dependent helicase HrpA